MEIMEFCKKVEKNLGAYIGDGASVSVKRIVKNNGVVLHSIMIAEKEMNISPNIYLNGLHEAYEKGETFQKIMREVLHIYEESRMTESLDMDFFLDYGSMKERVVYKLIRYESNRELLQQVPHIPFLDMAIVFYCHVPGEALGSATILIYDSHIKLWGITKESLYEDAKRNTRRILPPRLLTIEEMMQEIFVQDLHQECGEDRKEDSRKENRKESREKSGKEEDWTCAAAGRIQDSMNGSGHNAGMYVLGNGKKLFGAAVILYDGVLERLAEMLGSSFFLLPSSIHETIAVPDNGMQKAEELGKMVCEINATQVEPEDVLTDSVYYFSRENKKLEKIF